MPDDPQIEVCAFNLDASEHPDGIYSRLLQAAADKRVKARGSDYAMITKPKLTQPGVMVGRLLVWTDIDMGAAWLDIVEQEELSDEDKSSINIPSKAKPNYRSFDYVFNEGCHRFYLETRNALRNTLGVTTAHGILRRLVSPETVGADFPEVEVTVVPEENALERVLGLPGLRVLYIKVLRPNADTSNPLARKRVEEKLRAANAQKLEETWTKAADAKSLEPAPETLETAGVAAEVGEVRSVGRDSDGRRTTASTQWYPRRWNVGESSGESLFERLRSHLRDSF